MLIDFLKDYLSIAIFLFIALALSFGFIVLNFLFSPKNPDPEKLSAYEFGFEQFNNSRIGNLPNYSCSFYFVSNFFLYLL